MQPPMNPVTETELKLLVPRDAMRRMSTHPLLKGRARPVTQKLYSIYFDTPGLDLWRQGVALRLRRDGRRWIQTVKGGGTAQAGLHQRVEIEAQVAGPFPDCTKLDDGPVAGLFSSARLRGQLKAVFVTEVIRTSRLVALIPEVTVEVCLDRGEIKAGDRIEPICELELELKSGPAHHLFEFALKLLDVAPLRVENRSKAERGYALARKQRSAPVKARAAALTSDMTVVDAFKAIVWAALGHLQANERGMLEARDTEYLHQMRIALRRMRSAFSVFAVVFPKAVLAPTVAELRWLAEALGPARDWDVFVTETFPPIRDEFAKSPGFATFTRECAHRRSGAGRKARRAVGSTRYQRWVLGLAGWLAAEGWTQQMDVAARATLRMPARDFAAAVIEGRYAQVRKRGRRLDESAAERHRLRIAVKKLRYAMDFFAGLFEVKRVRDILSRLSHLQDILGTMNDAVTVERLLDESLGAARGRSAIEARGILLGWSRGRGRALKHELKPAWKAFRGGEKFW